MHDLKVDKTTIGRVEDNSFQIPESSVSSHHCEVLLRGDDVVIRDLNSTNGTFINGEKISEAILKVGQTLRLGQIELRLEMEGMSAPSPAPTTAPAPSAPSAAPMPSRKPMDQTVAMQRGVSLNELEQGGSRPPGFDTTKTFSKKGNKTNKLLWIIGVIVFLIVGIVFLVVVHNVRPQH